MDKPAVYSPRAALLTSFFGGPVAAVAIHGLNVRFLGRWDHERVVLACALLVAMGELAFLSTLHARPDIFTAIPEGVRQMQAVRWINSLTAIVIWGAFHVRMHEAYHASERAHPYRSAWRAGLGCVLFGVLVTFVIGSVAAGLMGKP